MAVKNQVKGYALKARDAALEKLVLEFLNRLPSTPNERLVNVLEMGGKLVTDPIHHRILDTATTVLKEHHPAVEMLRRACTELDPKYKQSVAHFLVRTIFGASEKRKNFENQYGIIPPSSIVISPTMRCNLRCVGCYAGNYAKDSDLPAEVFERLLSQCEDAGISLITISGGEPFVYEPLLEAFEKHNKDLIFMVYTNGSLITKEMAHRLRGLGNVAVFVSVEGFEEETDARRGPGTFQRVMQAMDNLRSEGVFFGASVTPTRLNYQVVISDEFVDMLVDKGCYHAWYFSYMPIGTHPSLDLMPLPQQRNALRKGVQYQRARKPILMADFWNDGALVQGCMAGGKLYLHVNNNGDYEPCVFVHFAVDNAKEKSLAEALQSKFFRTIRENQPFTHNYLRPCPIIDYPQMMRRFIHDAGAHPTHQGAESLITKLAPELDSYSQGVADIYNEVWQEEYGWVDWFNCEPVRAKAAQEPLAAPKTGPLPIPE